jgi:hypothetical protein
MIIYIYIYIFFLFYNSVLLFKTQTASKAEWEQHRDSRNGSFATPTLVTPGPSGKTGALLGSLTTPINNEKHERLASAIQHALAFGRTIKGSTPCSHRNRRDESRAVSWMHRARHRSMHPRSVSNATIQISCGLLRNGKRDFEKAKTTFQGFRLKLKKVIIIWRLMKNGTTLY